MIKKFLPIMLFGFLVFILVVTNYSPGAWLTGWDNLHPEFNFALNIQRSIYSVWQEYQGLGSIGGLAYASDLIRQMILWVFSIVLPGSVLRHLFTFFMLLLGPLGTYTLLSRIIFNTLEKREKQVVSFLGGVFYLLNLATIQIFFTAFDSFTAFYGFLPWIVFSFLFYLKKPTKKNLLRFLLINILATTQWYVTTIFVVFIISLLLLITGIFIQYRSVNIVKHSIISLIIIFSINAFWLLPFSYFTFTHVNQTVESHMNSMSTEDIYLRNKQFGSLSDVVILKGFAFEYVDRDASGDYSYLMDKWRDYIKNPFVLLIGYSSFLIIILGIYNAIKHKRKYAWSFFLLFLFSVTMLASDTVPFSYVVDLLRNNIPLFAQVFRVSFTKFGNLALFTYSVFFAYGVLAIITIVKEKDKKQIFLQYISPVFLVCLLFYVLPAFQGDLFYRKLKLKIPNDYFELTNFFNNHTNGGRIALLPQYTYWGWNYYSWGYGGSGFLWYGIQNPTLDRAFDGYRRENENYYWEISKAIYSYDVKLFEKVLEKYQIEWVILDKYIIGTFTAKVLYLDKIEQFLSTSDKIEAAETFGKIEIYRVDLKSTPKNFVFLTQDLPVVNSYKWNNYDKAYEEYGNYITDNKEQITDNKKQRSTRGFGGLFGSFTQSRISDNSNRQGQNSQSKIEKSKIVDVKTHNFTLNNNKLITQKVSAAATPHTNITELNLSSAKGMTIVANATWPISAQISDNRLNWDLIDKSFTLNDNNTKEKSMSKNRGFNKVFAAEGSDSSIVGVSSGMLVPDIYYPFRSLFTGRKQGELEFGVETHTDYFSFKTTIPKELVGYKLEVPELEPKEVTELDDNDLSKKAVKTPQVFLDEELINTSSFWGAGATPESDSGQARMTKNVLDLPYIKEGNLEVRVPKINGYYSYNLQPTTTNQSPKSCDQFNQGLYTNDKVMEGNNELLRLTSIGSSNCLDFDLPNLSQDLGYLVTVENRNIEGKSLLFSVINKNSQRADIETYLPKRLSWERSDSRITSSVNDSGQARMTTSYFVIPPMEQYGLGYTLHLDNISIGRVKTVNDLGEITVNPIPYRFLTSLKIVKDQNPQPTTHNLQPISVDHPNPSLYQVVLDSSTSLAQSNTYLILSQSFDDGWKAYSINKEQRTNNNFLIRYFPFFFGEEIKDHVLVNNWENGWKINNETMKQCNNEQCNIIIVYLPQYLEYIGFILLGVGILIVIFYPRNHTSPTIN